MPEELSENRAAKMGCSSRLVRETEHRGVTVRVYQNFGPWWSYAPFTFTIQAPEHDEEVAFVGLPNKCKTKRSALTRGIHRAKWWATGKWGDHYFSSNNVICATREDKKP